MKTSYKNEPERLFGQVGGVFQKGVTQIDAFLFGKSDMKPQKFTDVTCLLVFLVFMIGMGMATIYGLTHGNLARLNHGYNWQGELCGVDEVVEDKPLLYYCKDDLKPEFQGVPSALNLKSPICVKHCPTNFNIDHVCKRAKTFKDQTADSSTGKVHTVTITEKVVAQKSYPTTLALGHYCVPDYNKVPSEHELYDSVTGMGGPIEYLRPLTEMGGLKRIFPLLFFASLAAMLFGFVFLLALRRTSELVIYASMVLVIASFFFSGLFFVAGSCGILENKNPYFTEAFSDRDAALYSLGTGCLLLLIATGLGTFALHSKNSIDLAVACVESACTCVFGMPVLFLMPVLASVAKLLVFLTGAWIGMYLITSGGLETGDQIAINGHEIGGLRRSFHYTTEEKFTLAYFTFGVIWLLEICNAVGQFAISYAVVSWYYVPLPKRKFDEFVLFTGIAYGLTYHLGTMAIGAFILALCRVPRLFCEFLAKEAALKGNKVVECIAKALGGCIVCVMKAIGFLNKNAYNDVAINCTPFCQAARNSWEFMTRNAVTIAVLNGACHLIVLVGTLAISSFVSVCSYELITNQERWTDETSPNHVASPMFVGSVIFLLTSFIIYSFMMVFDNTADVLLYTFCWNREHGHNSVARFAPEPLQQLLKYETIPEDPAEEEIADDKALEQGAVDGMFDSCLYGRAGGTKAETTPFLTK